MHIQNQSSKLEKTYLTICSLFRLREVELIRVVVKCHALFIEAILHPCKEYSNNAFMLVSGCTCTRGSKLQAKL